jgi:hypothetical protein
MPARSRCIIESTNCLSLLCKNIPFLAHHLTRQRCWASHLVSWLVHTQWAGVLTKLTTAQESKPFHPVNDVQGSGFPCLRGCQCQCQCQCQSMSMSMAVPKTLPILQRSQAKTFLTLGLLLTLTLDSSALHCNSALNNKPYNARTPPQVSQGPGRTASLLVWFSP